LGGIQHGTVLGRCGDRHDGVYVNDPQALNKRESREKRQKFRNPFKPFRLPVRSVDDLNDSHEESIAHRVQADPLVRFAGLAGTSDVGGVRCFIFHRWI
jgi:hypothetical protein